MVLCPKSGVEVLFESNINDDGVDTWIAADLVAVVEAEGMLSSIKRLTGGNSSAWAFGWETSNGQLGTDLDSIHRFSLRNVGISGLAILRLQPHPSRPAHLEDYPMLDEQFPYQLSVPTIGKRLTLHGSGFGLIAPSVLINNISRGVVANIIHPHSVARKMDEQASSLILTDARFLPGMEGGPVSWDETGELAGLSMLTIRRADGEPVDISLVIPVACILSAISPYITIPTQPLLPNHIAALNSATLLHARQAVVMLQIGQAWASGVVISERGRMVKPITHGTPLFAIGHGIFGPPSGILPLITSGFCSKVVTFNREPTMMITSAPVHQGNSGGVIVNTEGHFIGLVTGNGKTSTGRTITHLNFAIPLEAMTDTVNSYLASEDRRWLDRFNGPPARISEIWALRGYAPVHKALDKVPSKL
ncbi:hypothetical protein BG011_003259 [Mortierella polycephala]|uniref:Uncharacterized protein n=1 Tax=Mortierella polycephala TaxID=41804 RepID=A0A9P6U453_9FUNG|nr:hypothetical protein BG011_003259 [Mortierella polycephala]